MPLTAPTCASPSAVWTTRSRWRRKGYGTAAHHTALKRLGVTEAHRKSYAPVRTLIPTGV